MNDTQIVPFSFQDTRIRTLSIESQTWFVAIDVATVLGIANSKDVVRRQLDDDEKTRRQIVAPDGIRRETWLINESGLYALIMRSNKPEAKTFRKWVTNEVLPRLRRSGTYSVTNYTLEHSGQLAMFPTNDTFISNELKRQMMDVALSTRSTKVRNLLRLLKPIVFSKDQTTL